MMTSNVQLLAKPEKVCKYTKISEIKGSVTFYVG
jgi:hypothetical protein